MLHLSNIIAAGMRDWSVGEWTQWYTATAGFITVVVTPFLLLVFSHLKDLRNRTDSAQKSAIDAQMKAVEAETKASAAVVSNSKTNDRVNQVALATPNAAQAGLVNPAPAPPQPRAPVPTIPPTRIQPP